ncbi:MAG: hypothetical protein ACR2OA_09080 [Rubripirellula sp.]
MQEIRATIVGEPLQVDRLLGETFSAEYELEGRTEVETNLPLDNEFSGLFCDGTRVIADGVIHQIHDLSAVGFLFDIYMINGPEFLAVTTEELEGLSPVLNSRIRLFANSLKVFLTFT